MKIINFKIPQFPGFSPTKIPRPKKSLAETGPKTHKNCIALFFAKNLKISIMQ